MRRVRHLLAIAIAMAFALIPATSVIAGPLDGVLHVDTYPKQGERVDAYFSAGEILVRVVVNGQPLLFGLDTGASVCVLDAGAAHRMGVVPNGRNGARVHLAVGSFQASNVPFTVTSYDYQSKWGHVSGLLGGPFVASVGLVIDFPAETITMSPPADADAAPSVSASSVVVYDNLATVNVRVDGTNERMLIDTGSPYTMLLYHPAERIGCPPVATNDAALDTIDGAETGAYVCATSNVIVGSLEIKHVSMLVPRNDIVGEKYHDGILGRDILSLMKVTFSYSQHAVVLEPGP